MMELTRKIVSVFICVFIIAQVLALTGFATGDDREPNDKITQASSVSVNTTIYGSTKGSWDVDYYKFTLNAPGYISVLFNHDDGNNGHYLMLYSYDGTTAEKIWGYDVYETSLRKETLKCGLSSGTYYLYISGNNKLGTEENTYNFKINYTKASNWESEDNKNIYRADAISIDTIFYGSTMGSDEDFDYYKFTLNKSGYISILLNHDCKNSAYVYLMQYDGERLLNFTVYQNAVTKTSSRIYLNSGTYYILIAGYDSEYNFKVQYASENIQKTTQKPTQMTTKKTTQKPTSPTLSTPKTTKPYSSTVKPTFPSSKKHTEEVTSITYKSFQEPETVKEKDLSTYGDFKYYIENNIIIINNYFGNDSYVEIPETIGGLTVGCIASNAFENTNVEKIKVPDCVTQFGENAFGERNGNDIKIVCEQDSAAQDYAQRNGLDIELTVSNNVNIDNSNNTPQSEKNDNKTLIIVFGTAALIILLGILAFLVMRNKKEK